MKDDYLERKQQFQYQKVRSQGLPRRRKSTNKSIKLVLNLCTSNVQLLHLSKDLCKLRVHSISQQFNLCRLIIETVLEILEIYWHLWIKLRRSLCCSCTLVFISCIAVIRVDMRGRHTDSAISNRSSTANNTILRSYSNPLGKKNPQDKNAIWKRDSFGTIKCTRI